jgi:DNA-directed RNA polymerase specialized sigma24 family protein
MLDPSKDPTDSVLMRQAAKGDRAAFDTLWRRYRAAIEDYLRYMLGPRGDIPVALAEVHGKARRRETTFSRGEFASVWLLELSRHVIERQLGVTDLPAALGRLPLANPHWAEVIRAASDDCAGSVVYGRIAGAFEALPTEQREAIAAGVLRGIDPDGDHAHLIANCDAATFRRRVREGLEAVVQVWVLAARRRGMRVDVRTDGVSVREAGSMGDPHFYARSRIAGVLLTPVVDNDDDGTGGRGPYWALTIVLDPSKSAAPWQRLTLGFRLLEGGEETLRPLAGRMAAILGVRVMEARGGRT